MDSAVNLEVKLADIDSRCKSNTHQIKEIKEVQLKEMKDQIRTQYEDIKAELRTMKQSDKDVHELALSIKEVVVEMRNMKDLQVDMNKRLGRLEEEPAKNYKEIGRIITSVIITAVVTGAIAFLSK